MRISITSACNLRCRYCSPEDSSSGRDILTEDDIRRIAEAAVRLGVTHFRITGGEPLVSPILRDVIRTLKSIPGVSSVTLTTNGVMLEDRIPMLKESGIDGINVSLDTLDSKEFIELIGRDALESVLSGIRASVKAGIPTKINTVIRENTHAEALVSWASREGADIRFIEMMPIGYGRQYKNVSCDEIRETLERSFGEFTETFSGMAYENGPARYFRQENLAVRVGFISPIHGCFCSSCNRVRLTSDGILKPCLCYHSEINLKNMLDEGINDAELTKIIEDAILSKPEQHDFGSIGSITEKKNMVSIGG